jgi:hypothetical protein
MDKLEYNCKVNDSGVIQWPERMHGEVIEHFAGKDVSVRIERAGRRRSNDQNAYYWGVVVPYILDGFLALGENDLNADMVHEFLKLQYLPAQIVDKETGEEQYRFPRSTKKLKTWEFCLYIDNCIQFAAEKLGVIVPPPTSEYMFPQFQSEKETRNDYIERIIGYCEDISDINQLRQYYQQNPGWRTDQEITNIFTIRAAAIKNILQLK